MACRQNTRIALAMPLAVIMLLQSFLQPLPVAAEGASSALVSSLIQPAHAETIYRHLIEKHWTPRTGLFRSFPDSSDLKLSQQASTYEQAAMGLLAIRFGDQERARDLLAFFKKTWTESPEIAGPHYGMHGLTNFYNADFGTEGIEKTVHLGPNAWVGLFAARLANSSKDSEALQLALDIEYWMSNVLPHENGGVAMGQHDDPYGAAWSRIYSTENNISYYAFLTELLRNPVIDNNQRTQITQERDHVENWLVKAYDRSTGLMLRGTNSQGRDTIKALDTITWLISAVGPKRLAARGINPYLLMKNAEKTFEVVVAHRRGVDAADQLEANRVYTEGLSHIEEINRPATDSHRLIWYEGLGQYILAWSAMADYARQTGDKDRAEASMQKVQTLIGEFDLASLNRFPDQSAYPYATPGKFFRYGWGAPKESENGPASSLVAGIWRCFAGVGEDPLSGHAVETIQQVRVRTPQNIHLAERKEAVLYGTSEDMTNEAWRALNAGHWDHAAHQAEATIQEWSTAALYLQKMKMREVGNLVEYSGNSNEKKQIYKYWALNDVAAAYFILGQAQDHRADYVKAAQAFQQVVNHYALAQIWDPKGWFWSPVEAITNDYVLRDRSHYGWILPQDVAEGSRTGKQPY